MGASLVPKSGPNALPASGKVVARPAAATLSFPFPVLETTRLLLRPYAPADAEAFYALLHRSRERLRYSFPDRLRAVPTLAAAPALPRINVRCASSQLRGKEAIEVALQDNGPGFAREDQGRAFEVFFTTKVRGTGLGLAICKRIIEAHGGRIEVGAPTQPGALILIALPRRPS